MKSQKKHQKAKAFRTLWCCFNNQNWNIERKGEFYTVSFPTLEKRIGVPVVTRPYQEAWLNRLLDGTVKQGTAKLYKKRKKWYFAITTRLKWNRDTKLG